MQVQGITNRGNQCYQNSVLQLLSALPSFCQFVLETDNVQGRLFQALQSFLRTHCVDSLETMRLLSNHEQHDAHEYLTILLDRLNDETGQRLCPRFFSHQVMTRVVNEDDPTETTSRFSSETILVVPFSSSLETSLAAAQETVVIEGWQSERHAAKVRALRSYVVSSWPIHLFILVQRVTRSKIVQVMDVPDTLYQYRVTGCIIHFGTPEYGHYVAVVRRRDAWFLCDDTVITRLSREKVNDYLSQAYLLVYSQDE